MIMIPDNRKISAGSINSTTSQSNLSLPVLQKQNKFLLFIQLLCIISHHYMTLYNCPYRAVKFRLQFLKSNRIIFQNGAK